MLLEPIEIGGCRLKNRLGFGPVNTGLLRRWPEASPLARAFYEQYFDAGLALVYFGGLAISDQGRANSSSLVLSQMDPRDDVSALVGAARKADARTVFQLEHAGRQAHPDEIQAEIVAPSAIACPVIGHTPRELTASEIGNVVRQFAESASVAQSYGADFIEIHAAHGYLLSSFLSPHTNRRRDKYGGSMGNRFRCLFEVLEETASKVSVPLGVRVNCTDNVPDGLGPEELTWGLRQMTGRIAFVSLSGGMYSPYEDVIMPGEDLGPAVWRAQARHVRAAVGLPVFLGGNINTASLANALVSAGDADVILMARELLADPQVLSRLNAQGKEASQCLRCDECKYHSRRKPWIDCPLNPVLSAARE